MDGRHVMIAPWWSAASIPLKSRQLCNSNVCRWDIKKKKHFKEAKQIFELEINGLHSDFAAMTITLWVGECLPLGGGCGASSPVVNIVPVQCAVTSGFLPLGQASRVFKARGIKHGESERLLDAGLQDRDKCGGGKLSGSRIK